MFLSQADDTWTNYSNQAALLKARKRERARKQREEYRQASEAKRAAGLTQRVAHDRMKQLGRVAVAPPAPSLRLGEVNGTPVVIRTRFIQLGNSWASMKISLPYLKFLDDT